MTSNHIYFSWLRITNNLHRLQSDFRSYSIWKFLNTIKLISTPCPLNRTSRAWFRSLCSSQAYLRDVPHLLWTTQEFSPPWNTAWLLGLKGLLWASNSTKVVENPNAPWGGQDASLMPPTPTSLPPRNTLESESAILYTCDSLPIQWIGLPSC